MTSRNFELRLEGISSPKGQITLRDLTELGSALQLTATRIARQVAGAEGPGRTPNHVDRISEIRLTGIGEGSTVLELSVGDEAALPMPDSDGDIVARRLEEAFGAIASNEPLSWASPLVSRSIGKFVAHLETTGAERVVASWGDGFTAVSQVIAVSELDETIWYMTLERQTEVISVTGRLDKVDLRARRFRVRDDVGHDISLEDVVDLDAAAHLIGRRVVATGIAERAEEKLLRIVEPTLTSEDLPADWTAHPLDVIQAEGVMPAGGIAGVGEDEVEAFLAEIRS